MILIKNKFPLIITGFYLLGIILFWGGITTFALRRVPDSGQPVSEKLAPIFNAQSITQTIVPQNNGLSTILIHLKNAQLKNVDPFIFSLADAHGNVLREISINGRNIGDGEDIRFQFAPISDSAGKTYAITLRAPYTDIASPHIEAGFSNTDTYSQGRSSLPKENGDLSFQLFYHPVSLFTPLKLSLLFISQHLANLNFGILLFLSTGLWYFIFSLVSHHNSG